MKKNVNCIRYKVFQSFYRLPKSIQKQCNHILLAKKDDFMLSVRVVYGGSVFVLDLWASDLPCALSYAHRVN